MTFTTPADVKYIIGRLNAAGYEAFAVGGCVRDSCLDREPSDWDITTSALPEEIKAVFPRTVDTGIAHGTVTVMLGSVGYETTTYRIDGSYSDSRHPDEVIFTRSLAEDLKRRDFTINAMAYSEKDGLVDMFGGVSDLENGIIRCVGVPHERFGEDALRILRAVRFSAQLGFTIEKETAEAARELAPTLANISAERIHAELHKLLMSGNPDRLGDLHALGIDRIIFPELQRIYTAEPSVNIPRIGSPSPELLFTLLKAAPDEPCVRWALLLIFTGDAPTVMRRLKFDNLTLHRVSELIRLAPAPLSGLNKADMRILMHDAGSDNMERFFAFRKALTPEEDFTEAEGLWKSILEAGDCTELKDLKISGRELIELGIEPGPEIGRILGCLLTKVLNDPSLNNKDTLLKLCREEFTQ